MSAPIAGVRVVVIGAGAVGTCAAYRLAQAGAQVVLVERDYPGGGTSGNSFAWLNTFGTHSHDYYRLRDDAIRAHGALEAELAGRWLTLNGGLHWKSRAGQSQFGDLTEAVDRLRGWGVPVEEYEPAELVRTIEPALSLDSHELDIAYVVGNEGWLQPALMVQAVLHRGIAKYGLRLVTGSVVDLCESAGGIACVVLKSCRRLAADVVVLAGGPASAELATMAGAALPIDASYGILAVTAPAPAILRHVVIAPDVSLRPDGGGRILATSGALSNVAAEARPSAELPEMKELASRLQAVVPALRGVPFEAYRRGVRALPSDGYPIVGFDPDIRWLYHAVMHSGITLCAGVANHIVRDLSGFKESAELAPYRPARFASGRTL